MSGITGDFIKTKYMKKLLLAAILAAFAIMAWGQDGGETYNVDPSVSTGSSSSDTTGNYIIRAQQIHDSLEAIRDAAIAGVALGDSGNTPTALHYMTATMGSKKLNLADSGAVAEAGHYATSKMHSLKLNIADSGKVNEANHYASSTMLYSVIKDTGNYINRYDTASLPGRFSAKQATLVSATNIKTINSTSLLGSGDIAVGGTETLWIADSAQVVHMADTAGVTGNNKIATKANVALKLNNSDTSTMLSTYARKLSPTLTGTPLTPTAAAGTNTTQIASTAYSFAAAQKAAGDTATARLNGAGELNTLVKMLADTIALFAFGAGHSIPVDTVVMVNFMNGGTFFWKADSFKVTDVRTFLAAGTGTEAATLQVFWGTSMGTAQDSLFTAAVAINSHTGESDVPSRYSAIKPRCYVWGVYRGMVVGHRPSMISSTIMGYIKRD
jgi:hypothetical protein